MEEWLWTVTAVALVPAGEAVPNVTWYVQQQQHLVPSNLFFTRRTAKCHAAQRQFPALPVLIFVVSFSMEFISHPPSLPL
jgi:hypothetical protein